MAGGAAAAVPIFGMVGSLVGGALGLAASNKGPNIPSRSLSREVAKNLAIRNQFDEASWTQQLSEALRNPYITEQALSNTLLGTPGGQQSYSVYDPIFKNRKLVNRYTTRTVDVPQMRGLLNIMSEDVLPAYDQMQIASMGRLAQGNIGLLNAYGPQFAQAARTAQDPGALALRDELLAQQMAQLRAGPGLDPALANEYAQMVRGAQSARGMGLGPIDAYQEAYTLGSAGEARRLQNQSSAANLYALLQQTDPNVLAMILGSQGNIGAAGQMAYGAYAPAMAPTGWDPMNPGAYVQDYWSTEGNRAATEALARYNAKMSLSSNLVEGGMSMAGGGMGAMMGGMGGGR